MKASESCSPSPDDTHELHHRNLAPFGKTLIRRAHAVVEEIDRHTQNARNLEQPPGADPVDAFFVFLHLLKSESQKIAQLLLTHADQHAPYAHAIADLYINRVCFLGHGFSGLGART
jgi:hypothetical protein